MTSSGTISGKIKREGVKKLDTLKFPLSFFALSPALSFTNPNYIHMTCQEDSSLLGVTLLANNCIIHYIRIYIYYQIHKNKLS